MADILRRLLKRDYVFLRQGLKFLSINIGNHIAMDNKFIESLKLRTPHNSLQLSHTTVTPYVDKNLIAGSSIQSAVTKTGT